MARQLINLYGEDVIIHMIQMPGAKKIISLYAEFSFMSLLKKAQDEVKTKKAKISKLEIVPQTVIIDVPEPPRPPMRKKNILNRLRDIDGEEEKC